MVRRAYVRASTTARKSAVPTPDRAGSTRLITGSTGTVEGTYTYTPYGATERDTGTATTPLDYDGKYTSSDTGLIYLRQRVYDPATAQFLSVDPLEKLTRAPYAYVEDNPVNAVDPLQPRVKRQSCVQRHGSIE